MEYGVSTGADRIDAVTLGTAGVDDGTRTEPDLRGHHPSHADPGGGDPEALTLSPLPSTRAPLRRGLFISRNLLTSRTGLIQWTHEIGNQPQGDTDMNTQLRLIRASFSNTVVLLGSIRLGFIILTNGRCPYRIADANGTPIPGKFNDRAVAITALRATV